ncbi:helix-turn-helix domain-containing protein [Adlercreutzia equolifaciens]|uniref:helix-turn-helix domain-containing protein n=1 Tax=Adlercreutzia equolifaciens TaxID=446660 RepID=UPI0026734E7E|nr:helix-turn-helix transcriptional regulator [Adlercreutzia equolifaciens]
MQELKDTRTIYQKSRDKAGLSRSEAVKAIAAAGEDISESSLKDYETGKTVPKPKNVKILADVYGTPELKWLHCSERCLLGKDVVKASEKFGNSDIYRTFFELAGAFNAIHDIQESLHGIVSDDTLSPEEEEEWQRIIDVLDRITESANELKVWAEGHRQS